MTLALDHVQIAIPAGGEAAARDYYGSLIGLEEIAKPAALAGRGGCWFQLGDRQLHLGIEDPFRAAKKAHVALSTDTLAVLRDRIEEAGFDTRDDVPLDDGRRRFFSDDPFGNRIEFIGGAA